MPQRSRRPSQGGGRGRRNEDDERTRRRQPERPSRRHESDSNPDESSSDSGTGDGSDSDSTSDGSRTATQSRPVTIPRPATNTRGPSAGQGAVGSPATYTSRSLKNTTALSSSPGLSASPYKYGTVTQTTRAPNHSATVAKQSTQGSATSERQKLAGQTYAQPDHNVSSSNSTTLKGVDKATGVVVRVAVGESSVLTAQELRQQGVQAHKSIVQSKTAKGSSTRYALSRNRRNDFQTGNVIEIRWAEPPGGGTIVTSRPEDTGITRTRRFIIVTEGSRYAAAVPILTYNNRGVGSRGEIRSHHGIVYTGRHVPRLQPIEEDPGSGDAMRDPPIHVERFSPVDALDPDSRINYARVYQLDQEDVEIRVFGRVSNLEAFTSNFRAVQRGQRPQLQPPPGPGGPRGGGNPPSAPTSGSLSQQQATTGSNAAPYPPTSYGQPQQTQQGGRSSTAAPNTTPSRQNQQTQQSQGSSSSFQTSASSAYRQYQQPQQPATSNTTGQTSASRLQYTQVQQPYASSAASQATASLRQQQLPQQQTPQQSRGPSTTTQTSPPQRNLQAHQMAVSNTAQQTTSHRPTSQTQQIPLRPAQGSGGATQPSASTNVTQAVLHLRNRATFSEVPLTAIAAAETTLAARSAVEQFEWFLRWLYEHDRPTYNRRYDAIMDLLRRLRDANG